MNGICSPKNLLIIYMFKKFNPYSHPSRITDQTMYLSTLSMNSHKQQIKQQTKNITGNPAFKSMISKAPLPEN